MHLFTWILIHFVHLLLPNQQWSAAGQTRTWFIRATSFTSLQWHCSMCTCMWLIMKNCYYFWMKDSAFSQYLHLMKNASASKGKALYKYVLLLIYYYWPRQRTSKKWSSASQWLVYSYFDSSQNNEHFLYYSSTWLTRRPRWKTFISGTCVNLANTVPCSGHA